MVRGKRSVLTLWSLAEILFKKSNMCSAQPDATCGQRLCECQNDVTMKQFRILTARRPFHSLSAQMSRLSSKVIVPMYHYQHTHEMISEQCCENDTTPESLVPPSHGQEDEYVFSDPYHSMQVLTGLNSLRQSASFCDITLCVDGEEFKCHKIVLAAFSPYFKAMFGGDLAEIINKSNVQALLSAANLLEVLSVRDACCDFLEKHMDVINCVGIHCFAESHACYDLQHKAKSFILRYFSDVVHQEEFGTLLHHKLAEFVSDDTLTVYREEDVFEAVVYWLKYDPENRKEVFYLVLEHVRLPLISPYYLLDCVEQADCVKNCFKCMELVEEAKKYHLLPDRKSEFMSIRTRPRKNAGTIEVLVAVGGEDDKVVLRSVECFDPRASSWKNLACLPFAISKHGLVVSGNNMIYLAGGEFPDGSESKAMWRYDPVFDAWQEMQSMNTTRSELGLAIVDGMIYAVGGWDGSCRLSSVEQYNPKTNMWMPVSQMKIAVTSPAVASYNGHLIVTGGGILEEGNSTNHVQSYDPKADVWTELTPMVMARSGSAACVLNHQIYVIGGWRQSVDNTNTVECYNPKTKIWKMVASLNCRRFRPGATVVDGKIYACGGEEGCDRYHETVECYDEKEDTWHIVSEMLSSRSWLGCAALRLHTDCLSQEKTLLCDRSGWRLLKERGGSLHAAQLVTPAQILTHVLGFKWLSLEVLICVS
ncbi:Kelch-like protein 2 [Nymphon striatum]|nr:Kelch-like protein 2 [Nymphon striatum]